MHERGPVSPCLNICALDEQGICRGCYRTLDEIAGWMRMNAGEQWAVLSRAEGRRRAQTQEPSNR